MSKSDDVRERFREQFESIKEHLQEEGLGANVQTHLYPDDSLDAQITIRDIPRGYSIREVAFAIRDAEALASTGDSWIQVGLRYFTRKDEPMYRKFKGMSEIACFPQRYTAANKAEMIKILLTMDENLRGKRRLKPQQVFIRVHWNKKGKRPEHFR